MLGFIARVAGLAVGGADKLAARNMHGRFCLRAAMAAFFLSQGGGGGLASMSGPSGDHRAAFLNAQNANAAMVSSAPRAAPPPPRA